MPPIVQFGIGGFDSLAQHIASFGSRALIFIGNLSLERSGRLAKLVGELRRLSVDYDIERVSGEPTTQLLDTLCEKYRGKMPSVIAAIGGGSVLDCGKACSVLLHEACGAEAFLEGAEHRALSGKKTPFIAVPTTGGTGSEATNNAVLIVSGSRKASLRNDIMLPDIALIDPELHVGSSLPVTLYCGMDALCQLIESYVSTAANPFTDALVFAALPDMVSALYDICANDADTAENREKLAYGAFVSGVGILNSSTGVIHGFASAIGGKYSIPHGAICASLLYAATLKNMQRVQSFEAQSVATEKYARIGSMFSGIDYEYDKHNVLLRAVSHALLDMREDLRVPTLSQLGVDKADFYELVSRTKMNGNPVKLAESELLEILELSY